MCGLDFSLQKKTNLLSRTKKVSKKFQFFNKKKFTFPCDLIFFLCMKMAFLQDLNDNDNAEQREKQSQYLDFLDDEVFHFFFNDLKW